VTDNKHVPQNIKQKIQKGEHIDLSILLSNNHHNVPAMQKLSIYQGELVTQLRSNQFKIVSVEQWTSAFIIFSETDVLKTVDVLDRATFFLDEPYVLVATTEVTFLFLLDLLSIVTCVAETQNKTLEYWSNL
jgi:hypothetical protein